jgi:putative oxidoreductase
MTNPLDTPTAADMGSLFARAPIGAYFVVQGVQKIAHGLNGFVSANAKNVPRLLPDRLGEAYLHLLPFIEIMAGGMLVLGIYTRLGGWLTSLMLISFMIAVTGIRGDGQPFHPNLIFLGITLLLAFVGGGGYSLDNALRATGAGLKRGA